MNTMPVKVKLKGLDLITLGFCAWMLLLIGFGWSRTQHAAAHFIAYLSIFTGVLALAWLAEWMKEASRPENCPSEVCKVVRPKVYNTLLFIRSYYPVLLFLYFFESVSATNRIFFRDWLDPIFMGMDKSIFGYLPSMEWARRLNSPLVSELLYFAYFSYYLMITGLPVLFYLKRRKDLDEAVFILTLVFYFCYFIYSWLPVIGGRYLDEAMRLSVQNNGGLFSGIMAAIYTWSPHLGGAFPSSHIAVALVLSLLAFRYFRKLGIVMLTVTFFLSIATVYCHYHWFIDSVFGILTGLLGYLLGLRIYARLSEKLNAKE